MMNHESRVQVILLINEARTAGARKHKACEILGLSIRTLERWQRPSGMTDKRTVSLRIPGNKFSHAERNTILATVNKPLYRDLPPCKIVPMLADLGKYIGSESTIYRILRAENQLSHRQASRPSQHKRPEAYEAHKANQVWSWDITYLPTLVQGLFFYLYLIMDIYSRKIVGWCVHDAESSDYAAELIKQSCLDEHVIEAQLVLHSDNGSPMKGITMIVMLEKLGVIPSFSRPSVSDDNPYSESLFKTLKYHTSFPRLNKFATLLDARNWCEKFTLWYNTVHLHSALKFVTPQQRHTGEDAALRQQRHAVYLEAQKLHPERWARDTRNWTVETVVSLNPNKKSLLKQNMGDKINIVA
jgi:putative transposase